MAQYNDWSKSYQQSLGNVKMAAIANDMNEMCDTARGIVNARHQLNERLFADGSSGLVPASIVKATNTHLKSHMDRCTDCRVSSDYNRVKNNAYSYEDIASHIIPKPRVAPMDDLDEIIKQVGETNETNRFNMMQNTHQLSDALKRVKPDNTPEGTKRNDPHSDVKYDPEVYKHVRDVPPLKPKKISFAERYANED